MATIVQSPDALSYSRNLKEIIISSSEEVSFVLKMDNTMLLEETYLPDSSNTVRIDVRDVIESELSFKFPSGDLTLQDGIMSSFAITVDDDLTKTFTVIRGGVERLSDTTANFLKANFLTWQPQSKEVTYYQPEWLTFYVAEQGCSLVVRFYNIDGTSADVTIAQLSTGNIATANVQFAHIWAKGSGDRYGYFDIWVQGHNEACTYKQRYTLRHETVLDEYYLCENSLGGLDTFRFCGDRKFTPSIEHRSLVLDDKESADIPDAVRIWSQNTGLLDSKESVWAWELFRSQNAYYLTDGVIVPIVLKSSSLETSAIESYSSYTFDYSLSSDDGLLNITRSDNLPDNIEIPGPDDTLFFLAPRLIDYPDAALGDSWLIPLQSAFEAKWYKASVGGLADYAIRKITDTYGSLWHSHDNLAILNKFGIDAAGNLTWGGAPVGGNGGSGNYVTIDGDQDISGVKTFKQGIIIGSIVLSEVNGRLRISGTVTSDGDIVAFGNEEGGGSAGGIDIARLWEELASVDSSKVIDKSHIPAPIWSDIVGKPQTFAPAAHTHPLSQISDLNSSWNTILKDDPSAYVTRWPEWTEVSGKPETFTPAAHLHDDRYLKLSGGTVSGDLKVTRTLTVGSIVLSEVNGRLHISGTVTSDGDIVAFGNEEGGGSAAGIDIARLWEELTSVDSSKVIDKSHIPAPIWSDIVGKPQTFAPAAHTHPWSTITGTPTTLAGYGITDAVTIGTSQTITGEKRYSRDTASVIRIENSAVSNVSNYVALRFYHGGADVGGIAGVNDGSAIYRVSAGFSHVYKLLDSSNYADILDNRYIKDGENIGTAYIRGLQVNGTSWNVLSNINSDITMFYAPTTAGTSGQVLQSTGGAPKWVAQNTLNVMSLADLGTSVWADANNALQDKAGLYFTHQSTALNWASPSGMGIRLQRWAGGNMATGQHILDMQLSYGTDSTIYVRTGQGNGSSIVYKDWYRLLHTGNYTSFPARYMSLYPGNGNHIAQNDAVPGNGQFGIYDVNTAATTGGNDGYIMALRWPSGNWCTQLYLDVDPTGVMALRHRGNDNVWTDWYKIWHSGNDGSGSGLDADLLDGYHIDGVRRGMSFLTNSFTAAGWYRVFTSFASNAYCSNEVVLHIGRTYNSPQNENYTFSICVGYNGDISITQLSGVMGGHLITKIRVLWANSKIFYIDVYSAASSYVNAYQVTGQGYGTFSAFTSGATIPEGYKAYEFSTVDGCKSDRGFTGSITPPSGGTHNIGTSSLWFERIYGRYIDTASGYNLRLCAGGTERLSIIASNGLVTATVGFYTPKLYIPSSEGNQKYYIRIE